MGVLLTIPWIFIDRKYFDGIYFVEAGSNQFLQKKYLVDTHFNRQNFRRKNILCLHIPINTVGEEISCYENSVLGGYEYSVYKHRFEPAFSVKFLLKFFLRIFMPPLLTLYCVPLYRVSHECWPCIWRWCYIKMVNIRGTPCRRYHHFLTFSWMPFLLVFCRVWLVTRHR